MKTLFILMVLSVASGQNIRNTSFTLYEVYPVSFEQIHRLKTFAEFCRAILVSRGLEISKYPVNVMVPKIAEETFGEYLMCHRMNFDIMMEGSSYLQSLAQRYPNKATVEKIGESGEGRDLIAIKISSGGNGTKPIIYIDAGIHGNEWIAPAQALYIIQQLVENPRNWYLTTNVDWLILPVANPDGYEFSLSVDPTFRKTRSKGINCIGVDLNRNFNFFWGLKLGSSSHECHKTYHGRQPFSEPETRALRNLILKYSNRIKLYLSFHSHSQILLYPWSHSQQPPLNVDELFSLGKRIAAAIETVAGTHYEVGQIPHLLYPASGDSISWAKAVAGIQLSYAIELPPKAGGARLPLSCIKFVVLEMFEGVKTFHAHIEYKYRTIGLNG